MAGVGLSPSKSLFDSKARDCLLFCHSSSSSWSMLHRRMKWQALSRPALLTYSSLKMPLGHAPVVENKQTTGTKCISVKIFAYIQ